MSSPSTTTANSNMISAYNSPTYFVSPTSTTAPYNSNTSPHHYQQPQQQQQTQQQQQGSGYSAYGMTASNSNNNIPNQTRHNLVARPKLTTTLWEDEGTICYQVDANGICVARRQDNDMINGTKLLNVAGMSRGKRDGILKNEKGRVVVKVGAMHLKGVW
ncbi:transcription regulator HTH, apses-type DNA-binding domain-containing protein, partial [Pilaira anomala]